MIFGGFSIDWVEDFAMINDRVFLVVDLPVLVCSMLADCLWGWIVCVVPASECLWCVRWL
jgi:hypothetical protein